MSVIEALALGLPVVSTNVGGIPFLLDHGEDSLTCDARDIEGFTLNVIRLLEDSDLAFKFSKQGRAKAQFYSWENVRPMWLNLLKG